MLRNKLLFLLFILFIAPGTAIYSQPSATVHLTGGFSLPVGSLKGTFGPTSSTFTTNNPDTNTYYMKTGYGFGIVVRKAFGKEKHFELTGGLSFNLFHQNVEYSSADTAVSIYNKMNITTVSAGAAWSFLPTNRHLCPYAGASIDASVFSGSLVYTFLTTTNTQNMWVEVRLGLTLDAGIDFPIQNNVGAVIGTKYCITNIIGKNYKQDSQIHYGLNDAEHTVDNVTTPARTISYLQFYGGISFYFGR
jgi:outer membrane protein W